MNPKIMDWKDRHVWLVGASTGIGAAVALATAGSAGVLMARAHQVLQLKISSFATSVLLPGLLPYASALLLAWPLLRLTEACGRWTAAAMLMAGGALYLALLAALLDRWALTGDEKRQARALLAQGLTLIRLKEKVA